jgi:hypothetical protein
MGMDHHLTHHHDPNQSEQELRRQAAHLHRQPHKHPNPVKSARGEEIEVAGEE